MAREEGSGNRQSVRRRKGYPVLTNGQVSYLHLPGHFASIISRVWRIEGGQIPGNKGTSGECVLLPRSPPADKAGVVRMLLAQPFRGGKSRRAFYQTLAIILEGRAMRDLRLKTKSLSVCPIDAPIVTTFLIDFSR